MNTMIAVVTAQDSTLLFMKKNKSSQHLRAFELFIDINNDTFTTDRNRLFAVPFIDHLFTNNAVG